MQELEGPNSAEYRAHVVTRAGQIAELMDKDKKPRGARGASARERAEAGERAKEFLLACRFLKPFSRVAGSLIFIHIIFEVF